MCDMCPMEIPIRIGKEINQITSRSYVVEYNGEYFIARKTHNSYRLLSHTEKE